MIILELQLHDAVADLNYDQSNICTDKQGMMQAVEILLPDRLDPTANGGHGAGHH